MMVSLLGGGQRETGKGGCDPGAQCRVEEWTWEPWLYCVCLFPAIEWL